MPDIDQKTFNNSETEERFIANEVSWEQYDALLLKLGDNSAYRVTYLDGVLEILSPSRRQQFVKQRISTLLAVYLEESNTKYFPLGSKNLRHQKRRAGTKPNESYCLGTEKEFPDLAIEVVLTASETDQLAVYQRLGVKEVWFWQNRQFLLFSLRTNKYEPITQSELLPNLDVILLAKYVKSDHQPSVVEEFRQQIKLVSQ